MYETILSLYRDLKHFPSSGKLITTPKKTDTIYIKGKESGTYIFLDVLVYGVLFTVLSIMIIASTINYEVIFRPKLDVTKNYNEEVDYNKEFYSKSENATGLAFVIPVLSIMIVILVLGVFKYSFKSPNLFYFF
jgi:hypothetical protein